MKVGVGGEQILSWAIHASLKQMLMQVIFIFTSFSDNIVMADMRPYVSFFGFS